MRFWPTLTLCALAMSTTATQAAVTISTGQTNNVTCGSGVCAPTASNAVLNVNDLETYLASGNLEVTTTGSGGVQANNIVVDAALSWTNANALSFDAYQSIAVYEPVSVQGVAGLSLTTNDGGSGGDLSFPNNGNITFANLSSSLSINGAAYALVNTVKGLAKAVANNPSGDFALASDYDASSDGTYTTNPITTELEGAVEGLGNAISNLTMSTKRQLGGLFFEIDFAGAVSDLALDHVKVRSPGGAGGLAAFNRGEITRCYVTGSVSTFGGRSPAGALAAVNDGTISNSNATASVRGGSTSVIGGLVGEDGGTISESFAMGSVSDYGNGRGKFSDATIGGLAGESGGKIENSYATGATANKRSGSGKAIGGFVGFNNTGQINASYSTGRVSNPNCKNCFTGGLIGVDESKSGSLTSTYWDTDSSGITNPGQGAGTPPNDPGITGLSTSQFQSGLPSGFDPAIWAENPNINKGLPYLIANPPPK